MRPGGDYLSKIKGRPILYLSEEPIREPTPQPRSVYIENAYNMGENL